MSLRFASLQVILDPRVWRKEEGPDGAAVTRRREPVQCIKRDIVEALLQVGYMTPSPRPDRFASTYSMSPVVS